MQAQKNHCGETHRLGHPHRETDIYRGGREKKNNRLTQSKKLNRPTVKQRDRLLKRDKEQQRQRRD